MLRRYINVVRVLQMLSDIFFDAGEFLSLDILKDRISGPIYEYLFTYEGPFGFMKSLFGISDGELNIIQSKIIHSK